jgi:hypothetical protein
MKIALLILLSTTLFSFEQPYSGNKLFLSINVNRGKELILDDNSRWEIDPEDQCISCLWLSPFPLTISFSESDEYPYILTNGLSKMQVKAKAVFRE